MNVGDAHRASRRISYQRLAIYRGTPHTRTNVKSDLRRAEGVTPYVGGLCGWAWKPRHTVGFGTGLMNEGEE